MRGWGRGDSPTESAHCAQLLCTNMFARRCGLGEGPRGGLQTGEERPPWCRREGHMHPALPTFSGSLAEGAGPVFMACSAKVCPPLPLWTHRADPQVSWQLSLPRGTPALTLMLYFFLKWSSQLSVGLKHSYTLPLVISWVGGVTDATTAVNLHTCAITTVTVQ